jgi:hypothetical protein
LKPGELEGKQLSPEEMFEKIRQLQKENEYLKRQREILKKAMSIVGEEPNPGMRWLGRFRLNMESRNVAKRWGYAAVDTINGRRQSQVSGSERRPNWWSRYGESLQPIKGVTAVPGWAKRFARMGSTAERIA